MTPLPFSVVIPTRGTSPHLRSALSSLQRAIGTEEIEVVVVVDGPAVLDLPTSGGRDVRVIRSEGTGISDALNTGLEVARGEYVVRMDDDDLCHPGRFRDLLRLRGAKPDLIAGSIVTFGACRRRYARPARSTARLRRDLLHRGYGFAHPAATMRRDAVRRAGGYRRECDGSEDLDLWFRLLDQEAVYLGSPHVHLYYRVHEGQVSRSASRVAPQQVITRQPDSAVPCRPGCPGPLASLEAELGTLSAQPCPGYAHQLRFGDLLRSTTLSAAARWGALGRRSWQLALAEAVGARSWWHDGRAVNGH